MCKYRLPLLVIECKVLILFLIYPKCIHRYYHHSHIYYKTHNTFSATAFVAQLAERRTRFAGSCVRFSPKALELHTRKISLSFTRFVCCLYRNIKKAGGLLICGIRVPTFSAKAPRQRETEQGPSSKRN